MSLTREDMLRELELLPAWRLNGQVSLPSQTAASVAPPVVTLTEAESQVVAHVIQGDEVSLQTPVQNAKPVLEPALEPEGEVANNVIEIEPQTNLMMDAPRHADAKVDAQKALATDVGELQNAVFEALVDDATMALFGEDASPDAFSESRPSSHLQDVEERMEDDHLPAQSMSLGQGRRESIHQLDWEGLQACEHHCQACGLGKSRTNAILGHGGQQADWLIVGDTPSLLEDQAGDLLIGEAGQLLDNMLKAIGITRGERTYLTAALKCHAPALSDFSTESIQQCAPFLKRQIELMQPKIILVLGTMAASALLEREVTVTPYDSELQDYHGVPVVVVHHPAYLLRHPLEKAATWHALCMAAKQMHP